MSNLDRAEIRIVNGKTGDRTVHLSPAAVGVLVAQPRQPDNPWVAPGTKSGTHMAVSGQTRTYLRWLGQCGGGSCG